MVMRSRPRFCGSRLLPLVAAILAVTVSKGPASAASLEDTIREALATNPDVGVVREDRHAVDQELRQARALTLPSVDLRAAGGAEFTDSPSSRARSTRGAFGDASTTLFRLESGVTLTQLLFDGFGTQAEIARQKARVDSASYRVREASEFVALDAVEAHLDVLRNFELVDLAEQNVAAHERILRQVRGLQEDGTGYIADVRQTEARLAAALSTLAETEGAALDAIATYRRIVGIEPPGDLDRPVAPAGALPDNGAAAAALASVQNPTVLIAAADVDVARAEIHGARADFFPRFDIQLGANANDNIDGVRGSNLDASALVVMTYNLYRGGGDIAREREAFARMNESRYGLARARRLAEEDAAISYNALITARGRTEALRAQTEANRLTRDAYASQFDLGQRSLLDLLDSENELFVSRSSLSTAEITEAFAVYRVLASTGTLLGTLEIEAPSESVNINRTPDDEATPERVIEKSVPVDDPDARPTIWENSTPEEPRASTTAQQAAPLAFASHGDLLPVGGLTAPEFKAAPAEGDKALLPLPDLATAGGSEALLPVGDLPSPDIETALVPVKGIGTSGDEAALLPLERLGKPGTESVLLPVPELERKQSAPQERAVVHNEPAFERDEDGTIVYRDFQTFWAAVTGDTSQ